MITITIQINESESGLMIKSKARVSGTESAEEEDAMNAINTGAKDGFLKWIRETTGNGTLIEGMPGN